MALMLVLTVPVDDSDRASAMLWGRGVRAIEERVPCHAEESRAHTRVELWTSVGDAEATDQAVADLTTTWPCRIERVDDVAAQTCREHASPMWIGAELVVVPAWQHHEFAPSVSAVPIEPGGAFGLGDHPTTRLCLAALLERDLDGRRVADIGCGTGVLSVVAALRGAAWVRAVDVAHAAVAATRDNAIRNHVEGCIDVDDQPAQDVDGVYDVVLANILAPELIALSDELRRLTAPDGRLVVSGILAGAHRHVLDALEPMRVLSTTTLDGWAAVTLVHATR